MKLIIEMDGKQHAIDIPPNVADALTKIAERNGITLEAALEQAIANEEFFEEIEASGGKLLVEKDDKLRELVREPRVAEPA
jgi:hypothetical protein